VKPLDKILETAERVYRALIEGFARQSGGIDADREFRGLEAAARASLAIAEAFWVAATAYYKRETTQK